MPLFPLIFILKMSLATGVSVMNPGTISGPFSSRVSILSWNAAIWAVGTRSRFSHPLMALSRRKPSR
jgi:hypothetical protein